VRPWQCRRARRCTRPSLCEAFDAAEEPAVAPEAVFEIRSRDDRENLIAHKTEVYLRAGTELVCVLDPYARCTTAFDGAGAHGFGETAVFEHRALPGFRLPLAELFAELER